MKMFQESREWVGLLFVTGREHNITDSVRVDKHFYAYFMLTLFFFLINTLYVYFTLS